MYIHRRYYFALDKKAGQTAYPLRIRVQWGEHGCHYLNVGVGVSVEPDKWSKDARRCKANTTHGDRHLPANVLNKRISEVEEAIDAAFRAAEVAEQMPTPAQIRTAVDKTLGRTARTQTEAETLPILYERYIRQESRERQWTDGTLGQMRAFGKRIAARYSDLTPSALTERFVATFVADCLRDDFGNRTTRGALSLIRHFGRWLAKNGYPVEQGFFAATPRLKTVQRNVIYLTPDELHSLFDVNLSSHPRCGKTLQAAADILLFCSFTGLRISDAGALRWADVHPTYIEVRAKKTGKPLHIELNKHSRAVLERMPSGSDTDYVLPSLSRTRFASPRMREACRLAGIDAPVSQCEYRGSERIERRGEKWEFVTTHTGRRTFICNALSVGIAPQVVMKWTGHSDYAAMRPYIDIVDAAKAESMARLDLLF